MAVNKVICNQSVLIDLTQDTVVAEKLQAGLTAHNAAGEIITGTCYTIPLDPLYYDYNIGYVANGAWIYENPTQTYIDIYEIFEGRQYFYTLGANVGTRFRSMTTDVDVTTITSGRVTGTQLINLNNPKSYASGGVITCEADGYLIIGKDNVGKTGVKTYVYDITQGWL